MKKKILAFLLMGAMVLSLASCGSASGSPSSKESTDSSGTSEPAAARTLESEPHPTKDPYEKYDPSISVTTIHTANDGAFWFPEGDSIDNNIYTRRYHDTLGIDYSFKWTCPGSQSTEKLNTMYASGDLPDVFSVNRTDFEKLQAAGSLADMTDAIIDYASDYTRTYLTGDYKGLLDAVTKDGKYYGIANGFSYKDGADMLWLRKDWMDELSLKEPTNLAELETVMEAFKAKGGYSIALNAASQQPWEWTLNNAFFEMFNSYPNIWYQNSKGEIEHGMFGAESRENTRAALLKAAEYYKKGYISPDFATMDFDMRNEDIFNGKCGVVFGDVWGAYWPLILHKDVDAKADWLPVGVPQATDKTAMIPRNDVQVQNILVCRAGFEHPEALVKMTNLYHDLNNNPETMEFEDYNTNPSDSNQIFLAYPLQIYNPSFNYEGFEQISAAQDSGKTDELCSAYKMFYEQAQSYEKTGDKGGWPPFRSYLKEGSSLGVIDGYLKNNRIVFNEYNTEDTEFMIENAPTVKKMFDTMVIDVITGAQDISAYDEFLTSWDSIYGDTATKEVNDWFQAQGGVSVQEKMSK